MNQEFQSPNFGQPEANQGSIKTALVFLWELVKVLIISLAIILPIRYFLVQPFYVKGQSMEPTFLEHDYLLIDELSFRFRQPELGEVIVFRYPRNPSEFFIKRVIGTPGDHVVISGGKIFVNKVGQEPIELTENYLPNNTLTSGSIDVTLANDQYYLLGDNRNFSLDSRSFGPIHKSDIVGRAWIRAWPFNRWFWFTATP